MVQLKHKQQNTKWWSNVQIEWPELPVWCTTAIAGLPAGNFPTLGGEHRSKITGSTFGIIHADRPAHRTCEKSEKNATEYQTGQCIYTWYKFSNIIYNVTLLILRMSVTLFVWYGWIADTSNSNNHFSHLHPPCLCLPWPTLAPYCTCTLAACFHNATRFFWRFLALHSGDFCDSKDLQIYPRWSTYGIFTYMWLIFMVNVGTYTSPMDQLGKYTVNFIHKLSEMDLR